MAVRVNRAPHNLVPQKWAFDHEIGPFIREILNQLFQLRTRTGGDEDAVSAQQTKELYPWAGVSFSDSDSSILSALFQTVRETTAIPQFIIPVKQVPFFSVTANHTCYGDEIVEAKSNITVYLNSSPNETEQITVKRNTTAGTVTIDGNGKNIDGFATIALATNYTSMTMFYSANSNEWIVI